MNYYIVPMEELAGLTQVSLPTMEHRKVGRSSMAA